MDGRRIVKSDGVFPYRLREGMRRQIINMFMNSGRSFHSSRAQTLGVIIEHCIKNNIDFILKGHPDKGYYITSDNLIQVAELLDKK